MPDSDAEEDDAAVEKSEVLQTNENTDDELSDSDMKEGKVMNHTSTLKIELLIRGFRSKY